MIFERKNKDLVVRNDSWEIVTVYPYGSEEQQRFEKGIEMLAYFRQCYQTRKLAEKIEKKEKIERQIDDNDKKIFRKCDKKADKSKRYNLTQTAVVLSVHRQTIYYWMQKGWVKPRRDYRNYPVFTVNDIEKLMEWKYALQKGIDSSFSSFEQF